MAFAVFCFELKEEAFMKTIGLLGGMSWESTVTYYKLINQGVNRLLGTRYTMEQTFYTERLEAKGLGVLVPNAKERELINHVIFEELCRGIIAPPSKQAFLGIIQSLSRRGAQAVILGCTEIGLLVKQAETPVPLFDTTASTLPLR